MTGKKPGWLYAWIREEEFWRSVTVNVFATLIAALVAFLFAVGTGYLTVPKLPEVLSTGAAIAGMIFCYAQALRSTKGIVAIGWLFTPFPFSLLVFFTANQITNE